MTNYKPTKEHKLFWTRVAEYYNKALSDAQILMYSEDVSHLSIKDLRRAFDFYRAQNSRFPLPADMLQILNPTSDTRAYASEIIGRIVEAIVKYDVYEPRAAQTFIGDIGWGTVQKMGGWPYLCETYGTSRMPENHFTPQARDLTIAIIENRKNGVPDGPINFEHVDSALKGIITESTNDMNHLLNSKDEKK